MNRQQIYDLVNAERDRQNAKWIRPDGWLDPNPVKLTVLVEEVGEVAQDVLNTLHDPPGYTSPALRAELVQVAAVAVAWLEMMEAAA